MDFVGYLDRKIKLIEEALAGILPSDDIPAVLTRGAKYSLSSGGKRIRPLLLLASCEAAGGNPKNALNAACAVELIHTYSLIHDDLPAMDDDDLRRGKPTLHKVIGEGNAILAGDALLTLAFQILAEDRKLHSETKVLLISELSRAAGSSGMVGGQAADIASEGKPVNRKMVDYIHSRKTGTILQHHAGWGELSAKPAKKSSMHLPDTAKHSGLAFQITGRYSKRRRR